MKTATEPRYFRSSKMTSAASSHTKQNRLLIIPGYGMGKNDIPSSIPGFNTTVLVPNWQCGEFKRICRDIADRISNLQNDHNYANVVIYGFSVGADIIMECANDRLFLLNGRIKLALCDPNINLETCFVTKIAAESTTFMEFKSNVLDALNGKKISNVGERDWARYLLWLSGNGAQANWTAYANVAKNIVKMPEVENRFKRFYEDISPDTGLRKHFKQQVVLGISKDFSCDLFRSLYEQDIKRRWIFDETGSEHFRFIEADIIQRVAMTSLHLSICG